MTDNEFSDGWTLKSLYTYFENKTRGVLETLHREHDKFEADISNRFKNTNELRGALDDLSKKMQTKAEADAALISLNARIDGNITTTSAKFDDINKQIAALNLLIVGNPEIRNLQNQANLNKGINEGIGLTKIDFYRALGAAVAVLGLIVLVANHILR